MAIVRYRAEGYRGYCGDYCVGETRYNDKGFPVIHLGYSFETREEAEKFMDAYAEDVEQTRDFED